jgi:hypothetical protein
MLMNEIIYVFGKDIFAVKIGKSAKNMNHRCHTDRIGPLAIHWFQWSVIVVMISQSLRVCCVFNYGRGREREREILMNVLLLSAHGYANCFTCRRAQSLAHVQLNTGPFPYVHGSRSLLFILFHTLVSLKISRPKICYVLLWHYVCNFHRVKRQKIYRQFACPQVWCLKILKICGEEPHWKADHHHWQNRPFWAISFHRRFCKVASGFLCFGFLNNIFIFLQNKVVKFAFNPQLGGPSPCIYIPQWQSGPVIPLGTWFPFLPLPRLAGLRWSYSNSSPHGYRNLSCRSGISPHFWKRNFY